MRELSQHISLRPIAAAVTDSFEVMADQPFQLDFHADSDDDGTFWNVDKDIAIDTPDAATLRMFCTERRCVVTVRTARYGLPIKIGSDLLPVRAVISSGLQTATLRLRGELTWDPLA